MSVVFAGMAASLDGRIAVPGGDLSWINEAMSPQEDYGFAESMERTGAYILGANTYRETLQSGMMGQDKTPVYVVTHQKDLPRAGEHVTLFDGDLAALVALAKTRTTKDICVFGGADILTQMLNLDLIDELGISIIPVLLGEGIPFFGRLEAWKKLTRTDCRAFDSGIVALRYRLAR